MTSTLAKHVMLKKVLLKNRKKHYPQSSDLISVISKMLKLRSALPVLTPLKTS